MNSFDFRELFILELANNHQGSVEHGQRIIREMGRITQDHGVRAAIKFQFRELDTFIHPNHRSGEQNKHIKRFLSTRLTAEEFATLADEVRKQNLISMATPFDEASVELIEKLNIEVVKIGSCSATDWPLIERIAETGKPVVFSTGGLALREIDALVSFFEHRLVHFAIMHCVSLYPTPDDLLQLSQIELLRDRYPGKPVGFSTHEQPDNLAPIQVAVAKKAELFERHVGVETDDIKLNTYSSTPEQIDRWLQAYKQAKALCGVAAVRPEALPEETDALETLKRGVYARKMLRGGTLINREDVYFAMPYQKGQLEAGEWKKGTLAVGDIERDHPLKTASIQIPQDPDKKVIYSALHVIKAILNEARIHLPTDFKLEISHHYGLSNFVRYGAALIECVNRDYCKKLIVQMPNQRHPAHFHRAKEETFQVLHGVLELAIDGRRKTLYPGDTLLIMQGVWHEFWNETGVIVEEISTTHHNNDSFYADKTINRMERSARKTIVDHWGRFQL